MTVVGKVDGRPGEDAGVRTTLSGEPCSGPVKATDFVFGSLRGDLATAAIVRRWNGPPMRADRSWSGVACVRRFRLRGGPAR